MSSWSINYNSWKNSNFEKIIIRYEDLIENPEINFYKIIAFLNKINDLPISNEKISKAISNTNFDKLKILEKRKVLMRLKKYAFFRKGKVGHMEKELKKDIIKKIEESFYKEMKELKLY